MDDDDLVLQGNNVCGFKLNSLIGDSASLKCLRELTAPAGLFLIDRPRIISDYATFIKKDTVIDDAVYETLVSNAEYTEPIKKKKTKRKPVPRKSSKTRRK